MGDGKSHNELSAPCPHVAERLPPKRDRSISSVPRFRKSLENGHYFEPGAIGVLNQVAPVMVTPGQFKGGLKFTETYYHRNGITVCAEPVAFFSKPMQDAINGVYSDDDTPFVH